MLRDIFTFPQEKNNLPSHNLRANEEPREKKKKKKKESNFEHFSPTIFPRPCELFPHLSLFLPDQVTTVDDFIGQIDDKRHVVTQ